MKLLIVLFIVVVFSILSDIIITAIKKHKENKKGGSENDRIS